MAICHQSNKTIAPASFSPFLRTISRLSEKYSVILMFCTTSWNAGISFDWTSPYRVERWPALHVLSAEQMWNGTTRHVEGWHGLVHRYVTVPSSLAVLPSQMRSFANLKVLMYAFVRTQARWNGGHAVVSCGDWQRRYPTRARPFLGALSEEGELRIFRTWWSFLRVERDRRGAAGQFLVSLGLSTVMSVNNREKKQP